MSRRQRMISIQQWAALLGLADDARSIETARTLITQHIGPKLSKSVGSAHEFRCSSARSPGLVKSKRMGKISHGGSRAQ